jgi:protein CpxP
MKKLIVTFASALLVTGAYAQASAPVAPTMSGAVPSHAPRASHAASDHTEDRIRQLHAELNITPSEEELWGNVAQAMRDEATEMDEQIARRHAQQDMMSAIDDLNNYAELAQAHADGVKKMSAVFAPLYNSMTDEQKKIADKTFRSPQHLEKHAMKHRGAKPATSKAAAPDGASSQP